MLSKKAQTKIEQEKEEDEYFIYIELDEFKNELYIGKDDGILNLDEFLIDVEFNIAVEIDDVWRLDRNRVVVNNKLMYDISKPVNAFRVPIYHEGYE